MARARSAANSVKGQGLRFDLDTLRELAGEKVFMRGEEYFRDGEVTILSLERDRVLAEVAGTEDYRTVLSLRGGDIGGECSCPAFADWGFCKHMVATGLAANAAASEGDEVGALSRILSHLRGMGVDALAEMMVDLAEHDPVLFRRLDLAAAAVGADEKAVKSRLRRAIDSATRTDGYVEYRAAAGWAEGVDEALAAVADLVPGRAELVLKLVVHAIGRIEDSVEDVDDSDGHCGGLLRHAQEIHLKACRAARPDPVGLARDLFAREMEDDYDRFGGAVTTYADVLGEAGLAEYRRLALEAWDKLPPRIGRSESSGDYDQLISILDVFAEREGDDEARIALRAKDLSATWSYLKLAEFCLAQGREEEALRRAEEGLWMFEDDRPDERLVFFAAELLTKVGRVPEAEAHVQRAFEKAPSIELYVRLCALGGNVARDRALSFLEASIASEDKTPWHHAADLLVAVLTNEKEYEAAWATVRAHGASTRMKESLARASEATHPAAAVEVYAARVEELVGHGNNQTYAEAAMLIDRMAKLRAKPEQADYVARLRAHHGRKRNFMKLLT